MQLDGREQRTVDCRGHSTPPEQVATMWLSALPRTTGLAHGTVTVAGQIVTVIQKTEK